MRRGLRATPTTRTLVLLAALANYLAAPLVAQASPPSPLFHGALKGDAVLPDGTAAGGAEIALVPVLLGPGEGGDLGATAWFAPEATSELVERHHADSEGRIDVPATAEAADGRLAGVFARVEWVVFVVAPGCRPHVVDFAASVGPTLDLGQVRLERGAGLRGRLVDENDAPYAGAEVSLQAHWPDGRFGYHASTADGEALLTRTDSQGEFAFPGVCEGPLTLHAQHREAAVRLERKLVPPPVGQLVDLGNLTLPRGGRIAGRVVDDQDAAIAGARLYAADGSLGFDLGESQDPISSARSALSRRPVFSSDADGRFTLTGVRGPSAHVLVLAPGRNAQFLRCLPVGATDVSIVMSEPEARFSVLVSDALSEEVIANAEIVAARASGKVLGGVAHPLPVRRLGDSDEVLYEIGQVGPALDFIQVTAPGYAPTWLEPDGLPPGGHRILQVALRPAALLEGLVIDSEERPVAGVTVSAFDMQAMFSGEHLVNFGASLAAPVRSRQKVCARSDVDGRYVFTELTPGTWTFEAELAGVGAGEDFVTSLMHGSTRTTRMVLAPKASEPDERGGPPDTDVLVRGRVFSGLRRVPGAGIWLERADQPSLLRRPGERPLDHDEGTGYYDREVDTLIKATADSEGNYVTRVRHRGAWRLWAASPQGGVASSPETIDIGDTPVERDIVLGTHSIELHVTAEQDGAPLEGCWVWIDPGAIHTLAKNVWRTDADGRVMLEHLAPGDYAVTACLFRSRNDGDEPDRSATRASTQVTIDGTAGAEPARTELSLPRAASIEGTVRSKEGVLVPDDTTIFAGGLEARTQAGRFVISGLEAGEYRVFATASGSSWGTAEALGETRVQVAAGERATAELELTFPGAKPYRRELTRDEYYKPTTFDSAQWKDKQLISEGVRIRMIDDLLSRQDFVGMPRLDVLELLGAPDERFTEESVLTWYLGNERSLFAIDSEWLSLTLGSDDRVTEQRVWAD